MHRTAIGLAILAFGLMAVGCAPEYSAYRYYGRRPVRDSLALMSKQDVIALTRAKIGDDVIITMIDRSGSVFHLRTPDVIELADSGVSDTVISAMMNTDEPGRGGAAHAGYYGYYPPSYSWWALYPWWSPWYGGLYWGGYWGGFHRPYYYHAVRPLYGGVRYRSFSTGGRGYRASGGRR